MGWFFGTALYILNPDFSRTTMIILRMKQLTRITRFLPVFRIFPSFARDTTYVSSGWTPTTADKAVFFRSQN